MGREENPQPPYRYFPVKQSACISFSKNHLGTSFFKHMSLCRWSLSPEIHERTCTAQNPILPVANCCFLKFLHYSVLPSGIFESTRYDNSKGTKDKSLIESFIVYRTTREQPETDFKTNFFLIAISYLSIRDAFLEITGSKE